MSALSDFLRKHDACNDGRDWALATGCETVAELWLRDDLKPDWRIWLACRVLPDNLLRKFACRCVREVWHLLTDERSRNAVEVAERHADGLATDEELAIAWAAAGAAARAAAGYAARAAAWDAAGAARDAARAARGAAGYAARAAVWDAAWAARDAARAAAWDAAGAARDAARAARAAWDAAMAASMRQNEILRELVPTLEEVQP